MAREYEVQLDSKASKVLSRLERVDQQRIRAAIDLLAENPRPPKATPLVGEDGVYRVRVGDFRIVYEVLDEVLLVHVIRIGHRRDVYR